MAARSPTHLHHLHHNPSRNVLRLPAIEKYAYCLCLHVKPTTIFIAVFKLLRALLFASILLNTEFAINEQGQEINLSGLDERHKSTAAAMTILTRIIMASVSAVGIYAVASGRAALLMPLYAMLLVDFFFSLPAFYTGRDLDSSLNESYYLERNGHPMHQQYARYSIVLFSTVSMILKVYFLCVVWKCYRYLRLIELVSPIRLSEMYPHPPPVGSQYPIVRVLGSIDSLDLSSAHNVTPPPYESVASSMKPPNYEEAVKSSGAVFTVSPPMNSNADTLQQQSQHLTQQQPQQTVVFTVSNSEQCQNVSTRLVSNSTEVTPTLQTCVDEAPASTSDSADSSDNTTRINISESPSTQVSSSQDPQVTKRAVHSASSDRNQTNTS